MIKKFMASFIEIRPVSTEISRHVNCVLMDEQWTTNGPTMDVRPGNMMPPPRIAGRGIKNRATADADSDNINNGDFIQV